MDLEELCVNKGGTWLPERLACKIDDSLFYKQNKSKCSNDGDSFEDFKETGFMACREVPIKEFCFGKVDYDALIEKARERSPELDADELFNDVEFSFFRTCFSQKIPQKKINQSIDYFTYKFALAESPDSDRLFETLFEYNTLNEDNVDKVFRASQHHQISVESLFNQKLTKRNMKTAVDTLNYHQLIDFYSKVKIDEDVLVYIIEKDRGMVDRSSIIELYNHQDIKGKAMDAAIEKGHYYNHIVDKKMTDCQIATIMNKIVEGYNSDESLLRTLYENNALNKQNVSKAMEIGKALGEVYKNKMTVRQIDDAIEKEVELSTLYWAHHKHLTVRQKNHIIEAKKDLRSFFSSGVHLTDKMIDRAIEGYEELDSLYRYYELKPYQIDNALKKYSGLVALYSYNKLSSKQVDVAMEKGIKLQSLYNHQTLTPRQVDEALKIGKGLTALFENTNIYISPEQKTQAIRTNTGDDLASLYRKRKLTEENIDAAFDNPSYIAELYEHQKLTDKQINKARRLGINVEVMYEHQKLSPQLVDAIVFEEEDAENLEALFKHQTIPDQTIKKLIDFGIMSLPMQRGTASDTFTAERIEKAHEKLNIFLKNKRLSDKYIERIINKIDNEGRVGNIDRLSYISSPDVLEEWADDIIKTITRHQELKKQHISKLIPISNKENLLEIFQEYSLSEENIQDVITRGDELNQLFLRQANNITEKNISFIIEKGIMLHEAYEHLKLTSKNIDEALAQGEELENLISNQTLDEHHIDYLIGRNMHLSLLLNQQNITESQKERIYSIFEKKYGFSGRREGKVLSRVPPEANIYEFIEVFNNAVNNKIKEEPLKELVGTYPLVDPFNELREFVKEQGFEFRDGNVTHVYSGNVKRKLGKFLRDRGRLDLMDILTRVSDEDKREAFFPGEFDPMDYELVISDDPEDMAIRSTAMGHVQTAKCESIGHPSYGGGVKKRDGTIGLTGKRSGWRDDIVNNNLVAILKHKETGEWHARAVIRWCNREDDGLPDAIVETIYTKDNKKRNITSETIYNILNEKGFTGKKGPFKCVTEYKFTGYVDQDSAQSGKFDQIVYKIDERPKKVK